MMIITYARLRMRQNESLHPEIPENANLNPNRTAESRILRPRQAIPRKLGRKVFENAWIFVYMEAHKSHAACFITIYYNDLAYLVRFCFYFFIFVIILLRHNIVILL